MFKKNLSVSPAPHIHSGMSVTKVMCDVIIALVPAVAASVYFFGYYVILIVVVSVASCTLSEYVWQKHVIKTPSSVGDMSAVLTGCLLALTLPPTLPLWQVAVGGFFSVIFAKQVFGGIGHNPFNPALMGRAFLQIAWPKEMITWLTPHNLSITSATPLEASKLNQTPLPSYSDLFFGNVSGSLGETSAFAILIGAVYLIFRGQIKMTIPLSYIVGVAMVSAAYGKDVLFQLLAGGLMLGAFFMATDPVTAPTTKKGMFIFGIGCGLLTALIRFRGGFPEGVCFSILIMNMTVPIIDRLTIPKPFGFRKRAQ